MFIFPCLNSTLHLRNSGICVPNGEWKHKLQLQLIKAPKWKKTKIIAFAVQHVPAQRKSQIPFDAFVTVLQTIMGGCSITCPWNTWKTQAPCKSQDNESKKGNHNRNSQKGVTLRKKTL